MGIIGWILLATAVALGIYACIAADKAKTRCHKGGCTKCGRCYRMREDAEKN